MTVLDVLKNSGKTGMTREDLRQKCLDCQINSWLTELQKLLNKELVKVDKHSDPIRFLVTPLAWEN
jgi:DNA modification methylase